MLISRKISHYHEHDFLQDTTGCVSDSAHPIPVSPNGFLANTTFFKTRLGILPIQTESGFAQDFRRYNFLQDMTGCISHSAHLIPVLPNGFLAHKTSFKTPLGVYLTLPIQTEPGFAQDSRRQHDFIQDMTRCVPDSAHLIPVSPNGSLANTASFKIRLGVYLTLPIRSRSRPMVSSPTRLPSRYGWVCI